MCACTHTSWLHTCVLAFSVCGCYKGSICKMQLVKLCLTTCCTITQPSPYPNTTAPTCTDQRWADKLSETQAPTKTPKLSHGKIKCYVSINETLFVMVIPPQLQQNIRQGSLACVANTIIEIAMPPWIWWMMAMPPLL